MTADSADTISSEATNQQNAAGAGAGTGAADTAPAPPEAGDAAQVPPQQKERNAEARELERQLEDVRAKLREAEERARENLDRWQRAQADLANYRRRAQFEREELEKFAVSTLAAALLPVLDSFDRAWQTLPGQLRRLTWLSGMLMIDSQLRGTLQRIGVTEIEAEGRPFDPSLHEAIDQEEHEGQPHVVAVLQAGYKLHERVLRPALVKVGPKPAPSAPTPEVQASGGESGGAQPAPDGQDASSAEAETRESGPGT
jgi:molecular chaperone GrpE